MFDETLRRLVEATEQHLARAGRRPEPRLEAALRAAKAMYGERQRVFALDEFQIAWTDVPDNSTASAVFECLGRWRRFVATRIGREGLFNWEPGRPHAWRHPRLREGEGLMDFPRPWSWDQPPMRVQPGSARLLVLDVDLDAPRPVFPRQRGPVWIELLRWEDGDGPGELCERPEYVVVSEDLVDDRGRSVITGGVLGTEELFQDRIFADPLDALRFADELGRRMS